ncbi:hypothetical protein SY83_13815 [Paenibacillus swuensis]|uniref:SPOR domain-containing protein n=1 Tax=Paenibacillus swuensis TaxID=1178515 RepID=A0A172TJT2_9BACL|nr:SPOR domain-containing protein [Paenibacillus swuensis]ANE47164.1 hypothetical protein SY83_13815 [Paenibacillus swuensis]
MNKARITYRFDRPEKPTGAHSHKDDKGNIQGKVIPLTVEEVSVTETVTPAARDNEHSPSPDPTEPSDTIVFNPAPVAKQTKEKKENQANNELKPKREATLTSIPDKSPTYADTQPLNQFTTDYGAWNSPFTEETYRLERMIRESDRTAYAGTQGSKASRSNLDSETGYYVEETSMDREYHRPIIDERPIRPSAAFRTRGSEGISWFKIFGSVTAAIATGALFGYVVLSLFNPDSNMNLLNPMNSFGNAATQKNDNTNTTTQNPAANNISGANKPTEATAGTLEAAWPARTYYVLQNGVFSTLEGAETAKEDLKQKGYAAAWEAGSQYTVFVGMTDTQEQAKSLGEQLKQDGLEVYAKAFELPAVSRIHWQGGESEAPGLYAEQSSKLAGQLAQWTQAHLQDAAPASLTDGEWSALKQSHETWTKLASEASEGLPEAGRKLMGQMNQSMNNAVMAMEQYRKQTSTSYLWQAQSALLQFIMTEKEWLLAISADPS